MAAPAESVVLEEEIDENYEPTQDEIIEYATWLGMDLENDKELFWVAREGLKAPLPPDWKPCKSPEGEIYYFNFSSGESVWDHPCDEYYKKTYAEEKQKLAERKIRDARDEEKRKQEKKERKAKKKEAAAAQAAAEAARAANKDGGLGGGGSLGMPGLAPLSGLAPLNAAKALPAPKKAPTAAEKAAAAAAEAEQVALEEKFVQMRKDFEAKLADELVVYEQKATSRREGELKRELQQAEAVQQEKISRELAKKQELERVVQKLKSQKESEMANAASKQKEDRIARSAARLQEELDKIHASHEVQKNTTLELLRSKARKERDAKVQAEREKADSANAQAIEYKTKMLQEEMEKVKAQIEEQYAELKKQEEDTKAKASESAQKKVEEQRKKNDAEIKEQASLEKKRCLENMQMKLEMQTMRSENDLRQRLSQLTVEHELDCEEVKRKARLEMEEEIDKQCQALRDELSDQGSQVTDEVKKFIRPQVEELEKKQQAETKAKLEQMQKANDEKVEVMKREALDAVRSAHKAKVEAAQKEFDAELQRVRDAMGTMAREQAVQSEAKKKAAVDTLYKQKLEEVRKTIDAASEEELKQKQAEITKKQATELAEIKAASATKLQEELEALEAAHKEKLEAFEAAEKEKFQAENKAMISEQETKLAEAESKIEQELRAKEADDLAKIRNELAPAGSDSEIPSETEKDMEEKATLRLKRWELITEKLDIAANKKNLAKLRTESRGLRDELKMQQERQNASSNDEKSAVAQVEQELQQFKSSHELEVQQAASAHQSRMAELRAHAEQRRRDATTQFQARRDEVARQQTRLIEAQWTAWVAQQDTTRIEALRLELQAEADKEATEFAKRLAEMRQRVAEVEAAPYAAGEGGGGTGENKKAELQRSRQIVQKLKEQHAQLTAQIQSAKDHRQQQKGAEGRTKAWAGVAIAEDDEDMPQIDSIPSDGVSSPDSSDSANSWLIFPELTPLEATELNVSFIPHAGCSPTDLDQSSVYANPADIVQESKRLSRAEEFIRGQRQELQARKQSIAQLRATWKRDFKAASSSRDGGTDENGVSASKSKLALLASVRKMLDEQERNMHSEAAHLQSVSEYLKLRQQKLRLVETSFGSPESPLYTGRTGGGEDAKVMKRIDGIEQQLKQVVRMLQSRDTASRRDRDARRERDADRWAAPRGESGRVGRGRAAQEIPQGGVNTLGPSKFSNKMPEMVNSNKRPVWDYHKVLGQWAEERDVTRDLLSQHTAWIDTIQRELMKQQQQ